MPPRIVIEEVDEEDDEGRIAPEGEIGDEIAGGQENAIAIAEVGRARPLPNHKQGDHCGGVRQQGANEALSLAELAVKPEECERDAELSRADGQQRRRTGGPSAACQHDVGGRTQHRECSEIDERRVEGEHLRCGDAQRHADDEVHLVDGRDLVEIQDQAEEEVERGRVDDIHHLKRGDDVEPGVVGKTGQERQQGSRLRRHRAVRDARRDHVGVLTAVPAQAVVGFHPARSRIESGKEDQADCRDEQVGRPGTLTHVPILTHAIA